MPPPIVTFLEMKVSTFNQDDYTKYDKAAKENVLHKNKTNRLKSKLALKLKGNVTKPTAKKSTKSSK